MQAKVRDIQSRKAAGHDLITADMIPEASAAKTGTIAKHGGTAKIARLVFVALLSLVVAFALGGCRDTDVLTQKIVDNTGAAPVDYTLEPVAQNSSQAEKNRSSDVEDETDYEDREQEEDTPDYSPDEPTSNDVAEQNVHDDVNTNTDGKASSGGTESSDSKASTSVSDEGTSDSGAPTEEGDGGDVGAGDNEDADPVKGEPPTEPTKQEPPEEEPSRGRTVTIELPDYSDDPQPENDMGQPSQHDTWDNNAPTWNPKPGDTGDGGTDDEGNQGNTYADGTYDTIPRVGKVAAAGPYATIVQSLGGRGALAAAPQQWLDNLPAAAYDSGNELADVKGISSWGDGTVLTDAALQEVIESGAECVLTSDTFNVMSQEQAQALNARGINVLKMPAIGISTAMDRDVALTVDVVGELLKDAGADIEFGTKSAAATWKSMHNAVLAELTDSSHNGGYTFAIWGPGTQENYLYQGNSSEAKGPASRLGNSSPNAYLAYYVDAWDETENVPLGNHTLNSSARSSYDCIDFYFQHSGLFRGAEVISQHRGDLIAPGSRYVITISFDYKINNQPISNSKDWLSTPIVIARNEELARLIAQQATIDEDAFAYEGHSANLGYDYNVWIMPADSDGSWNDGTFSSFLVAPWSYSMVNGRGTSDADAYVNEFYSTFFRAGAADMVEGYGREVHVSCTQ